VNKIGIFAVSPLESDCLLERTSKNIKDIDLHIKYNNKTMGLCEYYNKVIAESSYEITVLCHHDISLEYANLNTLPLALRKYDVIGVAGGLNPTLKDKNLWHWMMPREYYRGYAGHYADTETMYITNFGVTPSRVALLDGVFLALDTRKIKGTRARFDERFVWHQYDIDFCLTCNKYKLKLGVWPITVFHQSPGLKDINDVEWNKSNLKFIEKWSNERV